MKTKTQEENTETETFPEVETFLGMLALDARSYFYQWEHDARKWSNAFFMVHLLHNKIITLMREIKKEQETEEFTASWNHVHVAASELTSHLLEIRNNSDWRVCDLNTKLIEKYEEAAIPFYHFLRKIIDERENDEQ